jgi:hypothetical protein
MNVNLNLPTCERNHCIFDQKTVNQYLEKREKALPELSKIIATSMNEKEVVQALYIVDRSIDNGVNGVEKLYPSLSRFNQTESPNIQTFLAGIYRKTQVPDAFGPLVNMLIKNSLKPVSNEQTFDPNEEIGGAIIEYIKCGNNLDIKA